MFAADDDDCSAGATITDDVTIASDEEYEEDTSCSLGANIDSYALDSVPVIVC